MTTAKELEDRFEKAMAAIGGVRPASIEATCTIGENADFVFPPDGVIAELKCLEEDPRDQGDFSERVTKLYDKWAGEGLVAPRKRGEGALKFETDSLPAKCRREFLKFIGNRIRNHALKANKQIKRTKEALNMPKAKGLFILCNTGNRYLNPQAIGYFVNRALGAQMSAIETVILFSFGMGHSAPGISLPTEFWIQSPRERGADIPADFLDRVRDAWMAEASAGTLVHEIPIEGASLHQMSPHQERSR